MSARLRVTVELGHVTPEVIELRARILRAGQDRSTAYFPGDEAPDALHALAWHDGEVVGVGSLIPEAYEHQMARRLRGMAVEGSYRGLGVGSAILEVLLGLDPGSEPDATRRNRVELVWCLARVRARSLYERYGFVVVGDEFVIEPIGPHVRMVRQPR
ncbi:MAG: GNAT family N-acetyltransferase [Ferrimicrobium sp.]|jgi:predicted GNAT family N-acyltransferase|nr:GNAT family N-acetyltransferase [Ferrimicrobium sp.]